MKRLDILDEEITNRGLSVKPKAIYVCKTNIADDGEKKTIIPNHSNTGTHRRFVFGATWWK
ncbi:hypothetical protein ACFS07_36395 [Undibacterium arcticum]